MEFFTPSNFVPFFDSVVTLKNHQVLNSSFLPFPFPPFISAERALNSFLLLFIVSYPRLSSSPPTFKIDVYQKRRLVPIFIFLALFAFFQSPKVPLRPPSPFFFPVVLLYFMPPVPPSHLAPPPPKPSRHLCVLIICFSLLFPFSGRNI